MNMDRLNDLTAQLEAARSKEAEARVRRLEIEGMILAEVPDQKAGTASYYLPGGRLVIERVDVSTVDHTRLSEIWDDIPLGAQEGLFRSKFELNKLEFRKLQTLDPGIYALVASAIVTKPAKPAVRFEAIK